MLSAGSKFWKSRIRQIVVILPHRKFSDCESSAHFKQVAPLCEIKRFVVDCMCELGSLKGNAEILGDSLVEADYRGIFSHGVCRLENYINDVKNNICNPAAEPKIILETVSTAVVCGQNGLGAVVGRFCMNLAIDKAYNTGIGMVVANGSNHYGIGATYTIQAAEKGFIGLSFTNSSPLMVPPNSNEAAIGTNPLSIAAPAKDGDRLVVDMAVTSSSLGAIEVLKQAGKKVPEGWALNDSGDVETNAEVALKYKKLMPLGGTTAGHKGFALAIFVEVMSSLLAGSKYGPYIRHWSGKPAIANIGHGFIAIDPKDFAPGFQERLSDLLNYIRNMKSVDPKKVIYVPGDKERIHMQKVDKEGGITYQENQITKMEKLAQLFFVKPIKFITVKIE